MIGRLDLDAIRLEHPLPGVVGANVKLIRAGNEFKACCPFHSEKHASFTIFDGGRRFHCFGCGVSGDVLDFIQRFHSVGLRDAADMLTGGNLPSVHVAPPPTNEGADRIEEVRAIWRSSVSAQGTLAETYLHHRGLTLPIPPSIRFTRLPYGKRGPEHPVLVACIASPDDKLVGIQRTYLNASGTGKAAVPKPKLSLGRISGCAIRLAPAAREIVVAEGLETGLSLQQGLAGIGRATWVSCGSSNMDKMWFPPGLGSVVIGADNDPAGEAAAQKAASAFADRGLRVRIIRPLEGFGDFNDEIRGTI